VKKKEKEEEKNKWFGWDKIKKTSQSAESNPLKRAQFKTKGATSLCTVDVIAKG